MRRTESATLRHPSQRHVPSPRSAFTMIEVIISIAIIVIMILVLIPSMRRSILMASATVCKHNLHQIYLGLEMYRDDNDGWLPNVLPPDDGGQDAALPPWFARLYPSYIDDLTVLTCPEDPFRFRMAKVEDYSDGEALAGLASYGINGFLVSAGDGSLANRRIQPTRPHDTILVADLGPDVAQGQSSGPAPVAGPPRNGSLLLWDDGFDPLTFGSGVPWVTTRHGDGINMLTITGVVRDVETRNTIATPIQAYYEGCAMGGCTICNYVEIPHYSFAHKRLYWWTGPTAIVE